MNFNYRLFFLVLVFYSCHAISAEVQKVVLSDLDKSVELYGVIEAENQATVSAQTSGRILAIKFDIGDFVKKGDTIALLRSQTQLSELKQAEATFQQAEKAYLRIKRIYAKKLVSKAEMDQAESSYQVAKAALDRARESVARTEIKAPYSGIVVKRHIEVGETANVGQPLLTGLSLEKLRVRIEVPENFIDKIKNNRKAYIRLNDKKVMLSDFRISPFADPVSHTFTTKISLPDRQKNLLPGRSVKVQFVIGKSRVLLIPESAVIYRSELTAVYVKQKDGKASLRQIRLGPRLDSKQVEVLAGLAEGEEVYLDPIKAAAIRKQQNNIHE